MSSVPNLQSPGGHLINLSIHKNHSSLQIYGLLPKPSAAVEVGAASLLASEFTFLVFLIRVPKLLLERISTELVIPFTHCIRLDKV